MNWDIIFRYKDSKFYEGYANFIEFIKDNTIPTEQLNKIDNFGYTPLHYTCIKSNIAPECINILLDYGADPYIISTSEGLTAFELALLKGNLHKMKIFIEQGYDINHVDEFGFQLEHKVAKELEAYPEFYKDTIIYLNEQNITLSSFALEEKTKENPVKNQVEKSLGIKDEINDLVFQGDYNYASLKIRTELENRFYNMLLNFIGDKLKVIIQRKSLHELIYDCFNLNIIDYESKEYFISAKRILNYFCHNQVEDNKEINEFLQKKNEEKVKFFQEIVIMISKI